MFHQCRRKCNDKNKVGNSFGGETWYKGADKKRLFLRKRQSPGEGRNFITQSLKVNFYAALFPENRRSKKALNLNWSSKTHFAT